MHVTAFGYRDVHLTGVDADRDVVLEPALRIRLVTSAKSQGHDPDYHLGFFLCHVDANGRRARMVYERSFPYYRMYFDADGSASLPMPGPGVYEVAPRVYVSGKDNVGRGGMLPGVPATRIEVAETSEEQAFRIEILQAVVDAAVQAHAR